MMNKFYQKEIHGTTLNDSCQKLFAFEVFLSKDFAYSTFLFELPLKLKLDTPKYSINPPLLCSARFFRCKAKWNLKNFIRFISFGFIKFQFAFDRFEYVDFKPPEQFNYMRLIDNKSSSKNK